MLSAVPARAPEGTEAKMVLETFALPIAPTQLGDRRAYARAVATGRSVTEFVRNSEAAVDIRALWAWLKGELQ